MCNLPGASQQLLCLAALGASVEVCLLASLAAFLLLGWGQAFLLASLGWCQAFLASVGAKAK